MRHLLVTNDFPPKVGGIQSYLWELWRRLDPDDVCVLTTPHHGAAEWDATQGFRIERTRDPVLLPHPLLARHINHVAADHGAEVVLLDPALPLGALVGSVRGPVGLVVHGAEVTVPGRLPGLGMVLGSVLRSADFVVAAGGYPLAEADRAAGRPLRSIVIPPGVDTERFHPLDDAGRAEARAELGLPDHATIVVSVSRLVPRKGMDTLIRAAARLRPHHRDLLVVIAGGGRDQGRLERLVAATGSPVRFLGRIDDDQLAPLVGCSDVFAMLCRDRWFGLEQEGFGIVFLEAAAAGVAQVAGRSGGSHEAVADGVTGLVVDRPADVDAVVGALDTLLADPALRRAYGAAGRARAVGAFSYERLAERLQRGLEDMVGSSS